MRSDIFQNWEKVLLPIQHQTDEKLPNGDKHVMKFSTITVSGKTYTETLAKLEQEIAKLYSPDYMKIEE